MFTAPATNRRNRPPTCGRPGPKTRSSWATAPLARVHTSTQKPVNFIRGELVNMLTPTLGNRFGHQHANSPARSQRNLSSRKLVNSLAGELLDKLASRYANVFTGKHVNQFQRKPVNQPSGSHTNTNRR